MRFWLIVFWSLLAGAPVLPAQEGPAQALPTRSAYVIPVKDQIDRPMFYVIRRGVKEAMEAKADVVILDMKTPGGDLDSTLKIIDVLEQFPGLTVTYVDNEAISAGAFIAYGTREIYMSERAVIGASAPIMGGPVGLTGGGEIPETLKQKVVSMIRAQMRACAERYGHNPDVIEAMIDPNQELVIGEDILSPKGELLTRTTEEAARKYGEPAQPLLSLGTVPSLEELYRTLGVNPDQVKQVEKIGFESIASWISAWSSILLIIGGLGLFIEYKTPGFGIFGIIGITALSIYFLGNYIAGLGGLEWLVLFLIGAVLIAVEIFILPGFMIFGFLGLLLMLVSLIMGMVDFYPGGGWMPHWDQLRLPFLKFGAAMAVLAVLVLLLGRYFPHSKFYMHIIPSSVSGEEDSRNIVSFQENILGKEGVALSVLRPGGKAQIGGRPLDVIAQSGMLPKGTRVRVISYSGTDAIVEEIKED